MPPDDSLPVENLRIPSESGSDIAAWFAPTDSGDRAVLLLHPLRANRRAMWGRAKLYWRAGYSVLLIDMQAHGESSGEHLTFGYLESRDAQAALSYLREQLPGAKVVVDGWSLGAAAAMLADPPLTADAFVLEAPYTTVEEATRNRVRKYGSSLAVPILTPMLLLQLEPRLGIPLDRLRPIDDLQRMSAPILFIAGSEDQRTTLAQSRHMCATAHEPKELWVIEGAAHVDFLRHDPKAFENRVFTFLDAHLDDH